MNTARGGGLLFTMRMTVEERSALDRLVERAGFRSAAECIKWLVASHVVPSVAACHPRLSRVAAPGQRCDVRPSQRSGLSRDARCHLPVRHGDAHWAPEAGEWLGNA